MCERVEGRARETRGAEVVGSEEAQERSEERESRGRIAGRECAEEGRKEVLGAEEQARAARVGGHAREEACGTACSDCATVCDAVERVAQVVEQLHARTLLCALESRQRRLTLEARWGSLRCCGSWRRAFP